MAAKKNKIRELRQEITKKDELILNLKRTIQSREHSVENLKLKMDDMLGRISWQCDQIKEHFTKEFTWMELTDDPNSQFKYLKRALKSIKHMAEHGDKTQ